MRRHSGCVCKNALYACDNKNLNMFQFFAQLSRNSNISLQESLFSQQSPHNHIKLPFKHLFVVIVLFHISPHKKQSCVKIYIAYIKDETTFIFLLQKFARF